MTPRTSWENRTSALPDQQPITHRQPQSWIRARCPELTRRALPPDPPAARSAADTERAVSPTDGSRRRTRPAADGGTRTWHRHDFGPRDRQQGQPPDQPQGQPQGRPRRFAAGTANRRKETR